MQESVTLVCIVFPEDFHLTLQGSGTEAEQEVGGAVALQAPDQSQALVLDSSHQPLLSSELTYLGV